MVETRQGVSELKKQEEKIMNENKDATNSSVLPELPEQLAIARNAIQLPEVQEMMRKLSAYNLGVYMPHMHDEKTGAFQLLPEGVIQVEDDLKVSFQSMDPDSSFVPVAWVWNDGPTPGATCKAICMTVHHAP
jgi:hypothetical protein